MSFGIGQVESGAGDRGRMRAGRELEQAIADYFAAKGYAVATNVFREGRSGGRHELDVLAERLDDVVPIRVLVECKDWRQPIDKDVVSKADYVMRDLGWLRDWCSPSRFLRR